MSMNGGLAPLFARKISLKMRFARFLATALPSLEETRTAKRSYARPLVAYATRNALHSHRIPLLSTLLISVR